MKTEYKVLLYSGILGILTWILDSLLDYRYYSQSSIKGFFFTMDMLVLHCFIAILFMVFGFTLALIIREIKKTDNKYARLNLILLAIRNINQLITKEKIPEALLKKACDILVEGAVYSFAVVRYWNESERKYLILESGLGEKIKAECEKISPKTGCNCFSSADIRYSSVTVLNPKETGCFLSDYMGNKHCMSVSLEYHQEYFGTLALAFSPDLYIGEESELLKEAAEDLSFALHDIELGRKHRKIDEALRISEDRYRTLFDSINNGVAIYRAVREGDDFVIVDFNRAAEKNEKISRDAVIEKSVLDVFPGVREFGLFDVFQRVWKTGKSECHPISLYRDDRIMGWRDNYVYKMPSGEIVAVYSDVTQSKQVEEALRESEKKYRTLFNSAQDMIFIHDLEGKFFEVNQTACNHLGYSREEFAHMSLKDIDTPEYAAGFRIGLKP